MQLDLYFCCFEHVKCNHTRIHVFISPLHNGPVYAGHQPRPHHNAGEQSEYAVADSHHHVIEKEEVVEAVEGLPEEDID